MEKDFLLQQAIPMQNSLLFLDPLLEKQIATFYG